MIRVGATVFVGKTCLTPYRVVGVAETGVPVIYNPHSDSDRILLCEEEIYCHVNFTDTSETYGDSEAVEKIKVPPKPDDATLLRPQIGEFVKFSTLYEGAEFEVRGFVVGKALSYTAGRRGYEGFNFTSYSVSEVGCTRTRLWQVPQSYMKELLFIDYLPLESK